MNIFQADYIEQLLKKDLPGAAAHRRMSPPGRKLTIDASERENVRYSSVLVLLFPYQEETFTCLVKRNAFLKNHPGQVGLPGGRIETGESPSGTALRETKEEIGVDSESIRLLGRLSELYVPISRFVIFPFVGWMDTAPKFVLNPAEADKLLYFPIERYTQAPKIEYQQIQFGCETKKIAFYPCSGEQVWGATAMILSEFFDVMSRPLLIS